MKMIAHRIALKVCIHYPYPSSWLLAIRWWCC